MSAAEARVLIGRLLSVIQDLRDLKEDAPQHVILERERHIDTLRETVAELSRTYQVSV